MFVKEIRDYDRFSDEADIIISDGKYDLLCYCFPTEIPKKGQTIKTVTALFAKNMMRVKNNEFIIKKMTNYYAYQLQGEVIDSLTPKICIGDIIIYLDSSLPKDIKEGEYIELSVDRLDCTLG